MDNMAGAGKLQKKDDAYESDAYEQIMLQVIPDIEKIRLKDIVDNMLDGITITDMQGKIVFVNATALKQHGYSERELLGKTPEELFIAECDLPKYHELIQLFQSGLEIKSDEYTARRKDGTTFTASVNLTVLKNVDGVPAGVIAVHRDVTEWKLRELALRRQALILDQMTDGVITTDLDSVVIDWNPAAESMFGYTKQEALGRLPWDIVCSVEETARLRGKIDAIVQNGGCWKGEIKFIRKDGREGVCESVVVPLQDENGKLIASIGVSRDITERKQNEEYIRHMASHDTLTGLPNRSQFMDHFTQLLDSVERRKVNVVTMFIDIDGFKEVNDSHGHEAGNQLLKIIAKRLSSSIRKTDCVGRFGGDEFVIMLKDVKSEDDVHHIAENILGRVSAPFSLNGIEVSVTVSIGISIYPSCSSNPQELIKLADKAMYAVKSSGKNGYKLA